jgi:hypothetical protein
VSPCRGLLPLGGGARQMPQMLPRSQQQLAVTMRGTSEHTMPTHLPSRPPQQLKHAPIATTLQATWGWVPLLLDPLEAR